MNALADIEAITRHTDGCRLEFWRAISLEGLRFETLDLETLDFATLDVEGR
jgi:hypothetical protein